jgi:hypothetical protein
MQAITTKYLPATNFRGSRIKATAQAGSVTVPWDDALGVEANHRQAACALMAKFGWNTHSRIIGSGATVAGYAFVLARKAVK